MKTPIKPFIVEVKRSRVNIAVPSNARPEPSLRIDVAVPSAKAEVSPARKAAEQMFNALLSPPPSVDKPILIGECAFEPPAAVAGQEAPPSPGVVGADQIDVPTAEAGNGGKRPAARAARKPASRKVAETGGNGARKKTGPVPLCPEPQIEDPVPPAPLPMVEETLAFPLGMTEASPKGARRDWKPGERWKRRLRHQR